MAQRAETDRGAAQAVFHLDRPRTLATVYIATDRGNSIEVCLSRDDLLAALSAPQRTQLNGLLDLLYAAALAKGGFV